MGQEENNRTLKLALVKQIINVYVPACLTVVQWKVKFTEVYLNQELQRTMSSLRQRFNSHTELYPQVIQEGHANMKKQLGKRNPLEWEERETVIKLYKAAYCIFQKDESSTLASGHSATKEMFHFLRPPEFSIFKERNGQELEQDNKAQDSPGSTLFIPVSLVIDNVSSWNSRRDDTSQALMAFGSNERETSSWIPVAVIDCDWDPSGTSLEKDH